MVKKTITKSKKTKKKDQFALKPLTKNKKLLEQELKDKFPLIRFKIESKEYPDYTYMLVNLKSVMPENEVRKIELYCYKRQNFKGWDTSNPKDYRKTGLADFIEVL